MARRIGSNMRGLLRRDDLSSDPPLDDVAAPPPAPLTPYAVCACMVLLTAAAHVASGYWAKISHPHSPFEVDVLAGVTHGPLHLGGDARNAASAAALTVGYLPSFGVGLNEAEAMYRRSQRKAGAASVTANDGTRNVWDLFEGAWPCATAERFGKVGDGGKWICDPGSLAAKTQAATAAGLGSGGGGGGSGGVGPCLVYSFGSNGELSFELDVVGRLGCEVHVFDPTLDAGTARRMAATVTATPGLHFHPWGLAPGPRSANRSKAQGLRQVVRAGDYVSLREAMAALGHAGATLDVLKVDIEGAEWAVFNDDVLCTGNVGVKPHGGAPALPFRQLLVELHHPGDEPGERRGEGSLFRLMRGLHAWGLAAFRREPNVADVQRCWEYSFVPRAGVSEPPANNNARAPPRDLETFLDDCGLSPGEQHRRAAAWVHGL